MRRIAIIGAGQAGIILSMELLAKGYDVTLFSDKTPAQYLEDSGRPTAGLFGDSLAVEKELGLNFWEDSAPKIHSIHFDICAPDPMILFTIQGNFRRPGLGVDQRLKFSRGLQAMQQRGGKIEIGSLTLAQIDALTAEYDLTIVAVGNRALGESVFERDARRSVYTTPKRRLFLVNLTGYDTAASPGQETLKFSFIPGLAEIFWVPFWDKDVGLSKSVLIESMIDSPADRFRDVKDAGQGLDLLKQFVKKYVPWESAFLAPAQPTNPITWLQGAIVPTVRKPVGKLPSGRPVMGIGDVVILNDPLAGQGANNATKMAHLLAGKIIERGEQPFDAAWMTDVFEEFWKYSSYVNHFSNGFLEPLQAHQQDLLMAASRRPDIAADIFEGFNHPPSIFPWFVEADASRKYLRQKGLSAWEVTKLKAGIMGGVLRKKLFGARPAVAAN